MVPPGSWSLGNDRSLTDEISVLAAVHAELRHHIPHSVQVRHQTLLALLRIGLRGSHAARR